MMKTNKLKLHQMDQVHDLNNPNNLPPQQIFNRPLVCIECGTPAASAFEKLGNTVRLSRCKNCGEIVDKYVEYDSVLIALDLVLQKVSVYKHLFNNRAILYPQRGYVCLW